MTAWVTDISQAKENNCYQGKYFQGVPVEKLLTPKPKRWRNQLIISTTFLLNLVMAVMKVVSSSLLGESQRLTVNETFWTYSTNPGDLVLGFSFLG